MAGDMGCQQVLWLSGKDEKITEVGSMNLFALWINENGGKSTIALKRLYQMYRKGADNAAVDRRSNTARCDTT